MRGMAQLTLTPFKHSLNCPKRISCLSLIRSRGIIISQSIQSVLNGGAWYVFTVLPFGLAMWPVCVHQGPSATSALLAQHGYKNNLIYGGGFLPNFEGGV